MTSVRRAMLHRVPMRHPGDTAGIVALFESGALDPAGIVAILGKTEGNGCVNDFTRPFAVQALSYLLAGRLGITPEAVAARVALVMSGGTEGGLSPHFLVFAVAPAGGVARQGARQVARQGARQVDQQGAVGVDRPGDRQGALAIGTGFTEPFAPEAVGRMPQVLATASAVRAAMRDAGLTDPSQVHYVQVKCPLLNSARIAEARSRGATVATPDTYASMGLSRGASALGVGLALGEVAPAALSDAAIGHDLSLFSGRASASAGVELMHAEVVVLGNSPAWAGDLTIAHAVMRDAIDLPAMQQALRGAGLHPVDGQLPPAEADRLVAVLAKAEPSASGGIRGLRHIMADDSDINATRHARALVGGVLAAAAGRTDLFVSGGAEHQGPDGGGPVAVIARRG